MILELIQKNEIEKKFYSKGATVHEQNTICIGTDVILDGELVAYSLAANGSETVVFTFGEGSLVGANLLFGKPNSYPMNIYCTEDCTLIYLTKVAVSELLKDYNYVLQYVQLLSVNSQGMNQKIAMFTQKTLRENLMDYLQSLSIEQNSTTVLLPISKKQLSDYLGVQRQSMFRELKRMREEGLIEIDNRRVRICY